MRRHLRPFRDLVHVEMNGSLVGESPVETGLLAHLAESCTRDRRVVRLEVATRLQPQPELAVEDEARP